MAKQKSTALVNNKVKKVKMREFTQQDWYGFAGAEGEYPYEPHIAFPYFKNWATWDDVMAEADGTLQMAMIADKNGLAIFGVEAMYHLECRFAAAMVLAKHIIKNVDRIIQLDEMGFEFIDMRV